MLKRSLLVIMGASTILFCAGLSSMRAETPASAALTGQVSSKEEGPLEGVLVGAKKAGSNITITVVSNQQGRYQFPASKLEPGQYSLRIRAVGYDLEGPAAVQIAPDRKSTRLNSSHIQKSRMPSSA